MKTILIIIGVALVLLIGMIGYACIIVSSDAEREMEAWERERYREMGKDGICRVHDRLYSKTIRYLDLNYQLAQPDDKADIFDGWSEFLNYDGGGQKTGRSLYARGAAWQYCGGDTTAGGCLQKPAGYGTIPIGIKFRCAP